MMSGTPRWLGVAAISLGLAACGMHMPQDRAKPSSPTPASTASVLPDAARPRKVPPQIREMRDAMKAERAVNTQFDAFLARVRRVETIHDPLKRCLAYPDPPGLSWTDAMTSAYCVHRFVHTLPRAQVRRLIASGHAKELDRRLAEAEHAQLTPPRVPDRLDDIYAQDFANASPSTRRLIDAWTRQRPHSAFAWAASGTAYVQNALKACGCKDVEHTSRKQFRAMHAYLLLARSDLDRALKLDPSLTPAYAAMIHAAGLESDGDYALRAARHGLAADPANYAIYAQLAWMLQPKWGGSVAAERALVTDALKHADANPLLKLLVPYRYGGPDYVEYCHGMCGAIHEYATYLHVYAQGATVDLLKNGGWSAHGRGHMRVALIYRSEAYRFDPGNPVHRAGRVFELNALRHTRWALSQANAVVRQAPHDHDAYDARGAVYETMGRYRLALADYRHALRIDPTSDWDRKRIRIVKFRMMPVPQANDTRHSGALAGAAPSTLDKAVAAWSAPNPKPAYAYALTDLNGDGRPDAIVLTSGNLYCGSGGCTMLVLRGTLHGFAKVSSSSITRAPLYVLPETRYGWHTLSVFVAGGGARPSQVLMRFNGKRYPLNPTMQPHADHADLAHARKLELHPGTQDAKDENQAGSGHHVH